MSFYKQCLYFVIVLTLHLLVLKYIHKWLVPCLSASSTIYLQCFYFTHQVHLFFEDNIADVGSAVYTNYLDFCSWYTRVEPYFDNKKAYRWNTFEFG